MLATPHFVFLHLPKTGGTFLINTIKEHCGGEQVEIKPFDASDPRSLHAGLRRLPAELRHLPRFTLVRNPWDWHVSWYAFMTANQPEAVPTDFHTFVRMDHDIYMRFVLGCVGPLDDPETDVGKTESLGADFLTFLRRHRLPEPDGLHESLARAPENSSDRGHYAAYYDADTRQIVEQSCGPMIRQFGYRF